MSDTDHFETPPRLVVVFEVDIDPDADPTVIERAFRATREQMEGIGVEGALVGRAHIAIREPAEAVLDVFRREW